MTLRFARQALPVCEMCRYIVENAFYTADASALLRKSECCCAGVLLQVLQGGPS